MRGGCRIGAHRVFGSRARLVCRAMVPEGCVTARASGCFCGTAGDHGLVTEGVLTSCTAAKWGIELGCCAINGNLTLCCGPRNVLLAARGAGRRKAASTSRKTL